MQSLAIRFQNVAKRYGASQVLRNVNLEIGQGEFFALVGLNGAGKTTLVKCLLDFCAVDSGTIEIFGVDNRLTKARAPLVFLPERLTPPYYLTGLDFLKYMLKLQSLPYEPQGAAEILVALDFDSPALSRPVRTYSKGMTQKLGLVACLMAHKDLYVLDEPMSGLDPKSLALLKSQLLKLRAAGRTLLIVSHALADVDEICNRMAILHEGRIRFVGSPADCRRNFDAETLEQAFLKCIG